jgi:hypothetical protein
MGAEKFPAAEMMAKYLRDQPGCEYNCRLRFSILKRIIYISRH